MEKTPSHKIAGLHPNGEALYHKVKRISLRNAINMQALAYAAGIANAPRRISLCGRDRGAVPKRNSPAAIKNVGIPSN